MYFILYNSNIFNHKIIKDDVSSGKDETKKKPIKSKRTGKSAN